MRPPGARFTIRTLMIAVAGVGMLIGGAIEIVRLRRLSREYRGRAVYAARELGHAKISADWSDARWRAECWIFDARGFNWTWFKGGRPLAPAVARKRIAYWEPIRSRYERAARYPWLPVAPDPPGPE